MTPGFLKKNLMMLHKEACKNVKICMLPKSIQYLE